MGVFASIKNWFKKNFGGGSGSKAKKARSVSNYGGGGSRTYRDNYSAGSARYQSREDEEKKRREQQQAKRQATTNALASISKRTDALASGKSSSPAASATSVGNGTARVLKKIEQKATPPDPKEQRRQDARKEREKRTEEFNKITKNKYNVDKNGLKARQAQKTQAYDAKEEMYEMQRHPNLTSFNRGVLSGVTFGGSELLAQKSKNRQETGAEQYYQQNKNKYAEFGGEVLGSLVGFGGTGEASARIVGKVAPKALKRGGTRLATKVARRAAEKEAVKRFGEGATKEVIEQIAKRRGAMLANEIGRDAATNLTTGLASDLSHSYLDSENRDEFKRNMRNNALLNVGLGSITSAVPALRVGRKFDDAIGNAVRNATELQNARQAMRDAFIREGDETKRINFNELLAQNSPLRQADEVVEQAPSRVGYHAGDGGRAEWYGNQAGSRRDTGHFGTGTYFAGSEDILAREGYGDRPLNEIDFSRYNMYRPQDADQGFRVHNRLKQINRGSNDMDGVVKKFDLTRENATKMLSDLDKAETTEDLEAVARRVYSEGEMEDIERAARERFEEWQAQNARVAAQPDNLSDETIDDLIDVDDIDLNDINSVERYIRKSEARAKETPIEDATYERAYFNELESALREDLERIRENGGEFEGWVDEIASDLGVSREEVERAIARTHEIINGYRGKSGFLKEDSASTIFMKELGFEGVDVTGLTGLDNTEFGSVIYNLRPEDMKQIREGKPRKPKVEPPRQAEAPKAKAETDFPYEGTPEAEEMNRRIQAERNKSAEEYANEREALEGRVKEIENTPPRFDEDEPLRVNKVSEDTPIGGTTAGERMAYSAYERNTGETVEGGIKSSWHDAWKASQEYHESHATGRDSRLSKTSVSQLNSMTSDTEREIREKLIDEGWLNYNVIRTDEMLDKVSRQFRDDPKRWVDDMIDVNNGKKLDFRETPEWQAMAHYIMAVVDPSADPASEIAYTEAYKLATQMSSKAGQTNNLRRQFVHLTPAGRRDAIVDEMAQILYNSQGFRDMHRDMPTDKFDALAYIKEVLENDPEIEKRVKRLVEVGGLARDAEYGAETVAKSADDAVENFAKVDDELPTGSAKQTAKKGKKKVSDDIMDAHADLMLELNKKNPKTKYDVVQEIRYLNMLGNPKTHIRNIFGSGFFAPIRQISNGIRAGIENSSYIKNSGLEVTKHGGLSLTAVRDSWGSNPTSEAGKKALEAYERVKPELLGAMKLDAQLYKGRAKTKAGKVLDAVSDFNSNWLSKEDDFFKQKAFRENYIKSYEAYAKRGTPITKKIEKKIEAEAMQEANIATFNEYNEFANWLAKITKKAGDPNASTFGKGVGIALNAVMPFTKVPANIMKQSVNYSPFGLLKGFGDVQSAIKKGNSELLNKAIDELASGVTGTVIFGMGMLLGKTTNAFTTNAGKDDAAAKFKKQEGVQNYSVTFTNPADGEKYSMTLDWLVPNSATFFAGVELANQLKSGDFDILDFGGDWAQVASRVIEPVMETSMLSGLYSMLESSRNSYGDDDKQNAAAIMIRETVQSYLNSLAPTAFGQASRTLYKNDKQITGDDDWEYFRNQLKSKVGLAETNIFGEELGADTTAYGDVKGDKGNTFLGALKEGDTEALGNYGKSALKNFLSPANIQKVDLDEVDEAKIKEYEDAVKNGADPTEMAYLFPKKQYKKQFTTGDLDVKLSNTDLSAYNQAKTTGGAEGMRYVLENIMFNRYVQDAKGNKTSTEDAYTPEMKQEMIKQFEGKSLREVEKWLREQPEFKNATEAERKRAIDGLWSYSKQGKAQGAKRVGEQAVIEKQGGDVNEYNFNNEISEKKRAVLAPLIAAGVVTYEQAVDFARYAGKTYYYENDEGGTSQTYYNKGAMMDYLKKKGYDDETAAALFNAFKAWNAKEYGSSSGYRRYGRGGYRRWHRGGGGSGKAKVPTPKTIKASDFVKGEALVSKRKSSSKATVTPKLERVKAKIDIPEAKW